MHWQIQALAIKSFGKNGLAKLKLKIFSQIFMNYETKVGKEN